MARCCWLDQIVEEHDTSALSYFYSDRHAKRFLRLFGSMTTIHIGFT
jgi:hypothetical protein